MHNQIYIKQIDYSKYLGAQTKENK